MARPLPSNHEARTPLRGTPVRFGGPVATLLGWVLVAWLPQVPANACRYSVRDTGFVEFETSPWTLRLSGFDSSTLARWQQAAGAQLLESNLRLEAVPSPSPSPGSTASSTAPVLTLRGPDDRELPLAPPAALPMDSPGMASFLDQLVLSPLRDQLHQRLLESFAVILLIEGTDTPANTAARRAADEAIRAFTPLLRSLPKPVDFPPRLSTLTPSDLAAERILVWSLGCNPAPQRDPRALVLFGRGRCLDQPLEGPLITRSALVERLHVIGQDCECDLDRSVFQGPMFPARWDSSRQTTAARSLGFDPENPLVRTEVSRIVLRGPTPGQSRRAATPSDADPLAFGYREDAVDPDPAAESIEPKRLPTNAPPASETASTPAPRQPADIEPPAAESSPTRLPWIVLLLAFPITLGIGALLFFRNSGAR
jgi:hypothetical protein